MPAFDFSEEMLSNENFQPFTNSGIPGIYPADSPVAKYGKLKVKGTQLCDERNKPVRLKGLFIRFLMEEGRFVNGKAFSWLSDKWKVEVIRVPFLPARWYGEPSYIGNGAMENLIKDAVRITEENGMYCIIDWHILGDGDPNIHREEAKDFFRKMAFLYGAKKHVIYEICNEPNGSGVKWENKIKPYAEYIIPAIRAGDSNAVILVGTPTWSQDVNDAADDPLKYDNIMYTFHFYAGTHKEDLRRRISSAVPRIPLFCTEWGSSDCYARGGPYAEEAAKWVEFMNTNNISWCYYSLTDYKESAAVFKHGVKSDGDWEEGDFTESGKYVRDLLTNDK
jgi:endoglucanase